MLGLFEKSKNPAVSGENPVVPGENPAVPSVNTTQHGQWHFDPDPSAIWKMDTSSQITYDNLYLIVCWTL